MCKISGHEDQMVELCMCERSSEKRCEMETEKQLKVKDTGEL